MTSNTNEDNLQHYPVAETIGDMLDEAIAAHARGDLQRACRALLVAYALSARLGALWRPEAQKNTPAA